MRPAAHRQESPGAESPRASERRLQPATAFTLIEVMIACGIFFMAIFTILALISNVLRNARALQSTTVDAGMVAAQLSMTNKLYEGWETGDFGDAYPGYSWSSEDSEIMSNGLHQVDFIVHHHVGRDDVETRRSRLLFPPSPRPD